MISRAYDSMMIPHQTTYLSRVGQVACITYRDGDSPHPMRRLCLLRNAAHSMRQPPCGCIPRKQLTLSSAMHRNSCMHSCRWARPAAVARGHIHRTLYRAGSSGRRRLTRESARCDQQASISSGRRGDSLLSEAVHGYGCWDHSRR